MLSKKPPRWLQASIRRLQQKSASQTQKTGSKTVQQQTRDNSAKTAVAQNSHLKDIDDNQSRLIDAQECGQENLLDSAAQYKDQDAYAQVKAETLEMSEHIPETLCAQIPIKQEQIIQLNTIELEDFNNLMKIKFSEFNSQLEADLSNKFGPELVQSPDSSVRPMPEQYSPIDEDNLDQQYRPTLQRSPTEEFSPTDETTCDSAIQYSPTEEVYHLQQYSPTEEVYHLQQYSPTEEVYHLQQYSPTEEVYHLQQYSPTEEVYHLQQYDPSIQSSPMVPYSPEDNPSDIVKDRPNLAESSSADENTPVSHFKAAGSTDNYNPVNQVGSELPEINHQFLAVSNDSSTLESTELNKAGATELQLLDNLFEEAGSFYRNIDLFQQQQQQEPRQSEQQDQLQLQQHSIQHQQEAPFQSHRITQSPVQSHCTAQLGVILPPPLHTTRKDSTATLTTRQPCPILRLPYPVETCGADLQRAFPGQIGRFYVTNAYSYAYSYNRMSIEMAAESMGFDKRNYINPSTTEANSRKSGLEDLENDLESDPRLTLMFLKPRRMNWAKLKNCLVFERCHPSRYYIADKWQMFCVLRNSASMKHLQMCTASGQKFDYRDFILYTANPSNYQKDLMQYLDAHPGIYILKRTDFSMGIGIQIYRAEEPNTVDKLQRRINPRAGLRQYVLQKYIERPLLVDKRKFDLRVYMLLISCKRPAPNAVGGFESSYFAFCYPGYVKLSCYPYNQNSRDLHVHLTNQYVQKRRPSLYSQVKEATTWFPDELNQYLNKRGRTEADWCQHVLYGQIRAIVGYVAAAFRPHLDSNASPASVYRLYGPDFIIDEHLRVWLLEVNTFPAYSKNTIALSGSIRNMWREAVTLATEATLCYKNHLPVEGLITMRNFRMAYSSEDPKLLNDLVRQNFA